MPLGLFAKADPDAELVASARSGDPRAFDALVDRYVGAVRRFARSRLDSAIDADDVAQEVFVAAWRDLPAFRGRAQFRTWLFGIAMNHCAEAARRHTRRRTLVLEEPSEEENGNVSPHALQAARQQHAEFTGRIELQESLVQLPDQERELLELYYYADLNLREIAELQDVNLNTLKYRFYQAHRRLRAALTGEAAEAANEGGERVRR